MFSKCENNKLRTKCTARSRTSFYFALLFCGGDVYSRPPPIELGGTYARSPSPEPPISCIGYHWQLQKNTPFPGFSREIFPRLSPPNTAFPEKMGTRMRPPYVFEWGGGGVSSSPPLPTSVLRLWYWPIFPTTVVQHSFYVCEALKYETFKFTSLPANLRQLLRP